MGKPIRAPETLSNPRAPTTSWPLRRIRSIPGRDARLNPRPVDRGGLTPVLGNALTLPGTGDPGGVPRGVWWPGTFFPGFFRNRQVALATATASARARQALQDVRAEQIRKARRQVVIVPGLSAVTIARGIRLVPDAPSQTRGSIRDIIPRAVRGVTYGRTVVPASIAGGDRYGA